MTQGLIGCQVRLVLWWEMAVICFTTPRGFSYILWVLFASSFVWFPYIGMTTLPCRRRLPAAHGSAHVARSIAGPDFTKTVPASAQNTTIAEVIQDQHKRMMSFCQSSNMPTTVYDDMALRDLYHHLLVDDEKRMIFCYVPKVGCSNWKRVFLILAGLVNPTEKLRPSIEIFRQVNSLSNYNPKEQEYRLRNYFKFMFIRHPPERVLSAYRNKIEHPIQSDSSQQSLWDSVRFTILSSYRMNFNKKMMKNTEIYPTFAEFLHFLFDSDLQTMNEHYKPMVELCQPCAVNYDFVGNFQTLRQDADAILDYLHINNSLFWNRGKHINNPTQTYIQQYYSKLHPIDLRRLEERYGDDIQLYNHLFPFENDGGFTEVREEIMKDVL